MSCGFCDDFVWNQCQLQDFDHVDWSSSLSQLKVKVWWPFLPCNAWFMSAAVCSGGCWLQARTSVTFRQETARGQICELILSAKGCKSEEFFFLFNPQLIRWLCILSLAQTRFYWICQGKLMIKLWAESELICSLKKKQSCLIFRTLLLPCIDCVCSPKRKERRLPDNDATV